MSGAIRILVIDDREMFRVSLRLALRKCPDLHMDCEAADGPAGVRLAAERRPNVAIVDIWLPGMNGIEVAAQIQQVSPATRIMLVSGSFDDLTIADGIGLGVGGIIAKEESPQQLAAYIRRIHDGEFCCSESLGHEVTLSANLQHGH
jgi:two-component system response regulator DesR